MMKRFFSVLFLLFIGCLIVLSVQNYYWLLRLRDPLVTPELDGTTAEELVLLNRLRSSAGNSIWPGLADVSIPVLLFNNRFEFLTGCPVSGKEWVKLKSDSSEGLTVYRRAVDNSQAFATKISGCWVASLGVKQQMNREMFWGVRSDLPRLLKPFFPFFLVRITDDMHVTSIFHEMFHAFQAITNEGKFYRAEHSHASLSEYPYSDSLFAALWIKEGKLLYRAVMARNSQELLSVVDSFITLRDYRRMAAGLSDSLILTEKRLEWLEGLAKYAEAKCYIAASSGDYSEVISFKSSGAYWQRELKQRLADLGGNGGDNRFYYSGSAMAFILDRVYPAWKQEVMADTIFLDDLLKRYRNRLKPSESYIPVL